MSADRISANPWPAGPLGPMVMPQAWHDYLGLPGFERDWNALMAAWKRWKRPIRAWQRYQWEREKNELRKWWFSLSRRERHYWLGRRDEGQFPNIVLQAMREFKGPKRQRGTIQMAFFGVQLGGETLSLDAANNTATNVDFSPSEQLYATFQWRRDGQLRRDNSGGTSTGRILTQINSATDWVTPRSSTVGDGYEIIWDFLTGNVTSINDESFTEDTWTQLNLDERVGMQRQIASVANTFDIDIGVNGTSTSLVNQDYQIESGDLV